MPGLIRAVLRRDDKNLRALAPQVYCGSVILHNLDLLPLSLSSQDHQSLLPLRYLQPPHGLVIIHPMICLFSTLPRPLPVREPAWPPAVAVLWTRRWFGWTQ